MTGERKFYTAVSSWMQKQRNCRNLEDAERVKSNNLKLKCYKRTQKVRLNISNAPFTFNKTHRIREVTQ